MSKASDKRAEEFLAISGQFRLGVLTTESSHPVSANLSEVAKASTSEALKLLFEVDRDVVRKYREWVESGTAESIKDTVLKSLQSGGRMFFTGCGSTGRLSIQLASIWRGFFRSLPPEQRQYEDRAFSVMAGGDFALIKSVEGFEDFTQFGRKQIADMGISDRDVVFAITEGGETSFVIGTAWQALDAGAKVYFVYNNPDDILREHVQRSREIIDEPRVEKINLTTGPMAITGSTRMQATSIQLCVMLTILEMVLRDLTGRGEGDTIPEAFLAALETVHAELISDRVCAQLARLVELEETVYRSGHKNNYFADEFGIDVLTDTTERSPTYCTPPFRRFDDTTATESWSFLFTPHEDTRDAWRGILNREPNCIHWSESEVRELVGEDKAARLSDIVANISCDELMKFKIGLDGLEYRPLAQGDSAVGIFGSCRPFAEAQLSQARSAGARTGLIVLGDYDAVDMRLADETLTVVVPQTGFLLDGPTRVGLKMLLNALSTCTMVRLGRVMGNYMIYVVASNLKLIDRATRYIQNLTGLAYDEACHLLFEVIEYVEPRMKSDQAYPPVVGLAVLRARHGLSNEEAEERFGA